MHGTETVVIRYPKLTERYTGYDAYGSPVKSLASASSWDVINGGPLMTWPSGC